jgi:hypothetical protein
MNRKSKSDWGLIPGVILLILLILFLIFILGLTILVDSLIITLLLYPFVFLIVKKKFKNFGIVLLIPLVLNTVFGINKEYNIIESIDYNPYFVSSLYENLLTKYSSDDLYSESDNKQLLLKTHKLTRLFGFWYTPLDEREMKLKNKQEIIEDILFNKYIFMWFLTSGFFFHFFRDSGDEMLVNDQLFKKMFSRISFFTWIWFVYTFYYFSDRLPFPFNLMSFF